MALIVTDYSALIHGEVTFYRVPQFVKNAKEIKGKQHFLPSFVTFMYYNPKFLP